MKWVLDSAQMKQCDSNTMEHYGMLSPVLMERAAYSVFEEILAAVPDRTSPVLAACGAGNNGGDGLALARLLYLRGYPVDVLFAGNEEKASPEARRQLAIVRNYGIPVYTELPEKTYAVVADSLFGIGLSRAVGGRYAELIAALNAMEGFKVAVDICSGISADSGAVMGTAFRADLTVTFGFAKLGHLLYPGAEYAGRVVVKEIGIDEHSLLSVRPMAGCYGAEDLSRLPARACRTNKGSYGRLLIFAGSRNMAGAAAFAAKAAYACGSGLVQVVTRECNRGIIQTLVPEAVLTTWNRETDMDAFVTEQLSRADAVAAGPGLGTGKHAGELVHTLLKSARVPCVLDADALNLIAAHPQWLREAAAPLIVTPHMGEMSRLTGRTVPELLADPLTAACAFAADFRTVTVLKDARTVVSLPDGFSWINTTGNNGMATGGSGDVLTGVIGSLLGQGMAVEDAAPLGVFLHGMAGDVMAGRVGKRGMTASDLITGLREIGRETES